MISALFPRYCVFCRVKTDEGADICPKCIASLPHNSQACAGCGIDIAENAHLCGDCIIKPPPWHSIRAPFTFNPHTQSLVHHLKYHHSFRHGKVIRHILAPHIQDISDQYDLVIPIPLHHRRLVKRGFNQSQFILPCKKLPTNNTGLRRTKPTPKLAAGIKKADRFKALKHAFEANQSVKNQRVLLVDDVMTTGATLTAATQALLAAEALEVHILVFARAMK